MTIIWLLVGLGLIVLGADWLVDGASSIARKARVSEFVIGLTIVGFGTSCPELVVSLTGALEGNADIAIGNVIGSNIFNVLFILGLTALLCPVSMTKENRKKDIPLTIVVTVMLLAFGLNSTLWEPVLLVLSGLAGLIYGGNLFVESATKLARVLGVSDKFIAVTILAGGTSLPELATSLVAALKGRDQLALGNILGSNVFNILLILGSSALITPLSFASITNVDALVLLLSMLLLLIWAYTGRRERIDRLEGAIMLLLFGAYYTYLFIRL